MAAQGDRQMRNRMNNSKDLIMIAMTVSILLMTAGIIDNPDPV